VRGIFDRRNACRDTWLPFVKRLNENVDVFFFSGRDPCLTDDCVGDIVHLDAPDSYDELPQKTYRLLEWAFANNYDSVIKVDDDTSFMPLPEHLAELTKHQYIGSVRFNPGIFNQNVSYAQGGCYALSRQAMQSALAHPELFTTGIEDGAVARTLKIAGIEPVHTDRIKTVYQHGIPRPDNNIISAHACPPEKLREIHDQNTLRLLSAYNAVLNKLPKEQRPAPDPITSNSTRLDLSVFATTPYLRDSTANDDSTTIVITSCGRFDLLKQTIESLGKSFIDAPIKETIIINDGPEPMPDWLREFRPFGLGELRWLSNGRRQGQWISADRAMDAVTTEYVFWCEDDWEFDGRPFMAESLKLLKDWKQIISVSLRGDDNTSGHPNIKDNFFPFKFQEPYWRQWWGGFSGNPGLRRKSDWQRIGSYGRAGGYGTQAIGVEQKLSKLYLDLNYRIAVLPTDKPFVQHLGERRSKAIDHLPAPPKVLIAVPCCWKYAYGKHENELRNGLKRETTDRIQAVRDTWLKDFAVFKDYVDVRFFYGRHPQGKHPKMQPDEVVLNAPDDYEHLPQKMHAIYQWALNQRPANYAYIFKADDDTAIRPDRLMRCGYERHDQLGFFRCRCKNPKFCQDYVTGGPGYFLSRRAMEWIVRSPITHWAEDYNTGKILRARNVRPVGHPGFIPGYEKHFVNIDELPSNWVTAHAVKAEDMRRLFHV
jgi:Galactosyltransferase/Glycosyl transferase family 2